MSVWNPQITSPRFDSVVMIAVGILGLLFLALNLRDPRHHYFMAIVSVVNLINGIRASRKGHAVKKYRATQ